jgi:cholesterol transport system auxiliary component
MSRAPFLAAAAMLLAGCSILPEPESLDIYRLGAASPSGSVARPFGVPTVMISLPAANRTIGGNSVMIASADGSMAVAAGASWAAPARNMMQDYIVQTFEASAPGIAALRPGDGLSGDYDLAIDLRDFSAQYDQGPESAPVVRVAAGARLVSAARELQGATLVSADVRASANRMADIVAAFDRASAQIATELAAWTEAAVAEAQRRAAAEQPGQREPDVDVSVDVEVD